MKVLIFLLISWAIQAYSPLCMAQDQPNIVLVMADDQGLGDMGYMGHPNLHTPHFDAAAGQGIRFDAFYAAAPVCSPTRASVMTGRHPNRMGVFKWGYPIRPQEITRAEILQQNGYHTGHFGKWHLGSVRPDSLSHPGKNGFDFWVSAPNFYDNDPILSHEGRAMAHKGESSMLASELALRWIDSIQDDDQPFLAVVWFGSPHAPHRSAPEDADLYKDQPDHLKHFFGEITGMDRAFGLLRDGLRSRGISEDTILWYCSDNGALPKVGSNHGLRGYKASVYEGGLRVPAWLEWPARYPKPSLIRARCHTSDILPTLLDWVGLIEKSPAVLDGRSLVPWIEGRMSESRQLGFWDMPAKGISTPSAAWMKQLLEAQVLGQLIEADEHSLRSDKLPSPPYRVDSFPGHAAWIDGDWKLHRKDQGQGRVIWELYDLKKDPAESHDLIAESDFSSRRIERMRQALERWLASVVHSLNGGDYF